MMQEFLQPISLSDPRTNINEICKQMLLLEEHLSNPYKRCTDCITKHFLLLQAYAEEGMGLCRQTDGLYLGFCRLGQLSFGWHSAFRDGVHPNFIAEQIRAIRKILCRAIYGY